jgi:hypothetical protein
VIDKTAADWPASIAATGLALASYSVVTAIERTLATLRFFWNSPQGPEPDAAGYNYSYIRTGLQRAGFSGGWL